MSRYMRFKFHNSLGRFISYAMNPDKNSNYLTFLFKLISRVRNESNQKSFYIEDGAKKIYDSVKSFLLNSNVNIVLNEDIDSFHVNDEKKRVELKSNNKSYYSKKLILPLSMMLLVLILATYFPQIALYLPTNLLGYK